VPAFDFVSPALRSAGSASLCASASKGASVSQVGEACLDQPHKSVYWTCSFAARSASDHPRLIRSARRSDRLRSERGGKVVVTSAPDDLRQLDSALSLREPSPSMPIPSIGPPILSEDCVGLREDN
jgi:hypothetical protein